MDWNVLATSSNPDMNLPSAPNPDRAPSDGRRGGGGRGGLRDDDRYGRSEGASGWSRGSRGSDARESGGRSDGDARWDRESMRGGDRFGAGVRTGNNFEDRSMFPSMADTTERKPLALNPRTLPTSTPVTPASNTPVPNAPEPASKDKWDNIFGGKAPSSVGSGQDRLASNRGDARTLRGDARKQSGDDDMFSRREPDQRGVGDRDRYQENNYGSSGVSLARGPAALAGIL